MSRLYRPFQTLFRSRITSRIQGGETVRIERVRIRKGRPTTRFLGTMVKFGIAYQLLLWALPPAPAYEERNDDGPEEEPLFIPLPGTMKKLPSEPYPPHGPEQRLFQRIHHDRELQKKIKVHLARIVKKLSLENPGITARIGRDINVKAIWLECNFPDHAPPLYERTGILVTDDAIALVTMPCESYIARQIQRYLWPGPMALGVWAFGKEAAKQTAHNVVRYLGFAPKDDSTGQMQPNLAEPSPWSPSANPDVQRALQRFRQGTSKRPDEDDNPGSVSSSARAPSAPPTASDKAMGVPEKPTLNQGNREPPKQNGFTEELINSVSSSRPWKVLKETYERNRPVIKPYPPRGSFMVSGLVALETQTNDLILDVRGWFDPKTKTFPRENLVIKPKALYRKSDFTR
ncbi:hypothetical protein P885DRAFT_39634 [Corynascus similis CBS 632.67]